MDHLFEALWSKQPSEGYAALKELLNISRDSSAVYPYMRQFLEKISDENSYFRTRALALITANAKWDTDCLIDENLDAILSHVTDAKPITARQFIQRLPDLAAAKPDLRRDILHALSHADTRPYPLSMRPLVEQDIRSAIAAMESR